MPTRKPRSSFYHEGKRYERTGKTQKDADQKAALLLDKLKRGEATLSGNITVSKWATEWLATYKESQVGAGQLKNYRGKIKVIITAIGNMMLKDVTEVHLQKILNSRTGYSKSDLSKLRYTMCGIFKKAKKAKLIAFNPAEDLDLPSSEDGSHRSIVDYEREYILNLAETHHAGLWVKTMMDTGIRPGESRALDWRHIDFKERLIHVELAMKANSKIIGLPKSAAGNRLLPIPDELYCKLLAVRGGPFEPVFTQSTTGRRHTESSMRSLWNNFKRELDISMGATVYRNKIMLSFVAPDLVPYCLRHTYCTDLQDAGVPLNIARYLMGHEDIALTAEIYTETTARAIQSAAEQINIFNKKMLSAIEKIKLKDSKCN
jgi:integrase